MRRRSHTGGQQAEPLDLGIPIDVGAPLPHLLADGQKAVLLFHTGLPVDLKWDGSSTEVVDPTSAETRRLGWMIFHGARFASLGPPNDKALSGHPLWGAGLQPYAAHEVHNSELIAGLARLNRVHPNHRPQAFSSLRHVLIAFHDETFDCVCTSWTSGQVHCDFPTAVSRAAKALTAGDDEINDQ